MFVFNPLLLFRSITRTPRDYLLTCGLMWLIYFFAFVSPLMNYVYQVPFIGGLLLVFVLLYFLVVQMRLIGLYYWVNRFRLGWLEQEKIAREESDQSQAD